MAQAGCCVCGLCPDPCSLLLLAATVSNSQEVQNSLSKWSPVLNAIWRHLGPGLTLDGEVCPTEEEKGAGRGQAACRASRQARLC